MITDGKEEVNGKERTKWVAVTTTNPAQTLTTLINEGKTFKVDHAGFTVWLSEELRSKVRAEIKARKEAEKAKAESEASKASEKVGIYAFLARLPKGETFEVYSKVGAVKYRADGTKERKYYDRGDVALMVDKVFALPNCGNSVTVNSNPCRSTWRPARRRTVTSRS